MTMTIREQQKFRNRTWCLDQLIAMLTEARKACGHKYGPDLRAEMYRSGNLSVLGREGERLMYLYRDRGLGKGVMRPHNNEISGNVHPVRSRVRSTEG